MGNLVSSSRNRNVPRTPSPQGYSTLAPNRNTGSPENLPACLGASPRSTTANKKALLIGIRYKSRWPASIARKSMDLGDAPHKETQTWRNMLIQYYDYTEEEITSMQDISKFQGTNQWPNAENIRAQLEELVRDAKHGDRRFLFIAAHGGQLPRTSDWTELDNQDEIIYTFEDNKRSCVVIKDNELRRILVESLPAGVSLTIVLELCHSGTLMDLPWQLKKEAGSFIIEPAKKAPTDLQGNILCLSACEDSQLAHHFRARSRGPEQGIITTIIQDALALAQGPPNLQVKRLHDVLVSTSARSAAGGEAQTPVVTFGRTLSKQDLETLVFRP